MGASRSFPPVRLLAPAYQTAYPKLRTPASLPTPRTGLPETAMTLLSRSRAALAVGGFVCSCLLALSGAFAAKADPLDWPTWRGPEQNGISRETGLVEE